MTQISQVAFTSGGEHKRSFLGDVASSALNVGATVGAGAAVGSIGGRIASLVPYKIKDADIAFQYGDMFCRAAQSETATDLLKSTTGTVKDLIQEGKNCIAIQNGYKEQAQTAAEFLAGVMETADDAFSGAEVQDKIKSFFRDTADKIPTGGYTKEGVKTRLQDSIEHAVNNHKAQNEYFANIKERFVQAARAAGDTNLEEVAKKGAKALRNRSIIGAGIAIGVITALALNIMKSFKSARAVSAPAPAQKNPGIGTTQG